jgi:hypothetical protein
VTDDRRSLGLTEVAVSWALDITPGRPSTPRSRKLNIAIENYGDEPVDVTIRHRAYNDAAEPSRQSIAAGGEHHLSVPTHDADGWYDFEITLDDDPTFRRRLTGHLEDGLPASAADLSGTRSQADINVRKELPPEHIPIVVNLRLRRGSPRWRS